MGLGKSTTMRFIAKHLREAGRPAIHIHERTDPHPVRATDELDHWFEPWKDTTPEGLAARALARWTAFVEYTQKNAEIPVLDGQLFHGDLTHLLLMGADVALISNYIRKLAKVIAPLNPLVVYLWQRDVDEAVRTVCAERGLQWVDYQVSWKLAAPYCVRKGLVGLDGLISLYRDYRQLTDDLFQDLPLAKLAIETSGRHWVVYEKKILHALGLPTK
ncbi:hypothetical protein WI97_12865 [Burkholderia vietnamiensis]|nr:hypothetical protein WI97_12865 [Burkholderia vietnamiensis]